MFGMKKLMKLTHYGENWLQKHGYNENGTKFKEVETLKPTSKFIGATKRLYEYLWPSLPYEKEKSTTYSGALEKAREILKSAFHVERGKRLDSDNPNDREILDETMPLWYALEVNHPYGEKKWFNKFGYSQKGPLPNHTAEDLKRLETQFKDIHKSLTYESLKKIYNAGKIAGGYLRRGKEAETEEGFLCKFNSEQIEHWNKELLGTLAELKKARQLREVSQVTQPPAAGGFVGPLIYQNQIVLQTPGEYQINFNLGGVRPN